ncbi:hypothetical protein B296_00020715 [Ensete ventricosum]|uniref:ATP-dependent DNA ligase family profile domain-containing protein n=1 Tax=Ensete ventricosum TaxID=4639 RepID=A0A427AFI2_ENSVE|nr:hypothetical protein B296_00020715 [Ensete ventricosum]
MQSKMRIGLAEKTVLVALGQAAVYSEMNQNPRSQTQSDLEEVSAAKIIKQVYSVLPIYDKIVPELLRVGVWKLPEACNFSLGVPVGPMLAKPTKAVSEILDKFQGMEFTCEYKYDGERAQIHYMEDGSVEIYSRNAERNTGKYPDVVSSVSRYACLIVIHASCYQGPPYRSIPAYQYPIDMTRWRLVPELEDEVILSLPIGERGVVSSPHGKTRQRPRPRARRRGVASLSHAGRRGEAMPHFFPNF